MSGPNPINITPDNNEITLQDVNRIINVVDNNSGTTVSVTQPNTSVIRIYDGGLQGPAGSGGGGIPGGSITQVQYNNNGAFGGVPILKYDGTTLTATGSFSGSFSGSYFGTASWAINALTASYLNNLNQNVVINGNLTVTNTASFNYTTASQIDIGYNIIQLNSADAARFAGISVFDSGSTATTASLFWDSDNHHWIYQNGYEGATYTGGMLISGPRNNGGLGNEQGTTNNALMKGQGGDHITSSALIEDGTQTTFYTDAMSVSSSGDVQIKNNLNVTGSTNILGSVNAVSFTGSLLGTASFVSDPNVTRDLYYLTASVNIGNTITGAPTTASVGQFSLPAGTSSGSMITINGFFSSTAASNTKTVIFLVNDNASTISLATYTGGIQFILSGRVVNSTTIRFFRAGGTINIATSPSFVDIASIGGVWNLKTSTTVNTGAGAGITNTLEALTVRL